MAENVKKYGLSIFTLLLLGAVIFIFYLDWQNSNRRLTFAMLDVGQGDALFIESPTGTQILIDGGPPRRVLGALSKVMSPFDRSIDAVIITNPDQDHIGGFLDVLRVYTVGQVFEPGTFNDSKTFQNLKMEIQKKNIPDYLAKRGMKLHLGGGAVIEILFPDRDVSMWDTNEGSVIARLTYGDTSVMLMGDSTIETERVILENFPKSKLGSDILKVGHHGSRSSSSDSFIKAVSPAYALISDGRDNKYGHPHLEVLETLANARSKVLRTDLLGTIIMRSDGKGESFSFHRQ